MAAINGIRFNSILEKKSTPFTEKDKVAFPKCLI